MCSVEGMLTVLVSAKNGAQFNSSCREELMKHVLPRLCRPLITDGVAVEGLASAPTLLLTCFKSSS